MDLQSVFDSVREWRGGKCKAYRPQFGGGSGGELRWRRTETEMKELPARGNHDNAETRGPERQPFALHHAAITIPNGFGVSSEFGSGVHDTVKVAMFPGCWRGQFCDEERASAQKNSATIATTVLEVERGRVAQNVSVLGHGGVACESVHCRSGLLFAELAT